MEIRNYNTGDELLITSLFKEVFKQEMSLEQWRWRFEQNPAGKHFIRLMWDGEVLVGHYAVSPIYVNVEGQKILTSHSLTTMTHPEYGGKGIFKNLATDLYKFLEEAAGSMAVWGFPNNNSHGGFIGSLGWKDIAVVHSLGISAISLKADINNQSINEIFHFGSEEASYILEKIKKQPVFVEKSIEYLNWRYVSKPAVAYKKFYGNIDGRKYLIVTKIYPAKLEGKYDLNLVELFIDDFSELRFILNAIMKSYELDFERITVWKNILDSDHIRLEKVGFTPTIPLTYLSARVHPNMPASFMDYKNWYVTMGDSDVF